MSEKSARKTRSHLSRYFRRPLLTPERNEQALNDLRKIIPDLKDLETEEVFYIQCDKKLTSREREKLLWLLRRKSEPENTSAQSFLGRGSNIIDVAPRLHFETSDSTNAVSICQGSGLDKVTRMEKGRRYKLKLSRKLSKREEDLVAPLLHDKMTEAIYPAPLSTFQTDKKVDPLEYINILEEGREAIRKANERYGTKMDEVDEEYYLYLFRDLARRNPTDAEWLHLSNAFSEHSRHHVFRAKLIINGEEKPFTLMELIQKTLTNKQNSVIAFYDNGSAIRGYPISLLIPDRPGFPSEERMAELLYHYVLTCETHNHPCLWAAYPGAATGGGGRRRDNKGVGRGGLVGGAVAGFMGGNLLIEGYDLPWEDKSFNYDPVVESPLSFFIRATKGAFDEGNQFGEPVTMTFAESLGILVGDERWEFIKPIMFSGGYSFIDSRHIKKKEPQQGWLVVKLGGKAYRIGLGGGAASSMIQGENKEELDFNSVQ